MYISLYSQRSLVCVYVYLQGQQQAAIEEEDDEVEPLTGEEMRDLIWAKYGKAYDVSFARRDVPGKAFVCLNIMWVV